MALIKKIRQRTSLAIGVIAVGLIFFLVGGDILSPNSTLLGRGSNTVGEIAGEKISYEEYVQKIEEAKFSFQQNTGRTPSENEMYSLREQAWQALIVERMFAEQYEELGMMVSDAELVDMVQGRNIVAELRQQLTNPETGEFDREQLIAFLQSLDDADPQQRAFWAQQERLFADARLRIKYDNLLSTAVYASKAEGKLEHKMENTVADVDHLFIPYYAVSDNDVQVTDSELKDYIKKNKDKFQVRNSRDIEYVAFPLTPSAEDSAQVRREIERLTEELRATESDSVFAIRNSETNNAFRTYQAGETLPNTLTTNVENLEKGAVYGPFLTQRSTFVTYKVSDKFDGTPRMRASHILFATEGMDENQKAEVSNQAEAVLQQARGDEDFATLAMQHGQDGTSQRGGDLGWFGKDDFIEEFSNVTFAAKSTGVIPRLVETEYGFHIIKVTEMPKTQAHKIATVELELIASDMTRNEAYRNADYFAASSSNQKEFRDNAQQENYRVLQANGLDQGSRNLNNISNAREVIRWAFNDASVNKVSDVFELDNAYVVAVLTDKTEEGTASLEQVREEVTTLVKNEKKAKIIADKLQGKNSLEDMKAVFDGDASLGNTPDLRLGSTVIPGVGFAPRAIGKVFGIESGKVSQPIKEDVGVILVKVNNVTPAGELSDYSRYQSQLTTNSSQRTAYMLMMAMEELAEVKDYRYRFF
ncbi:SurA N-terminal domain-containing protein [Litoribacter ruber]|uniref:peptidylprolyl isomerase n=1 Tax=Litoribacter ruber TaxID=702568 RepID=UPI001BDAA11B|nr:peptidylprolyl isomerase [Litoribacter ruber]MBT0812044.1 SurA N-terminal domain-containing protein [Litoribacter ruber]